MCMVYNKITRFYLHLLLLLLPTVLRTKLKKQKFVVDDFFFYLFNYVASENNRLFHKGWVVGTQYVTGKENHKSKKVKQPIGLHFLHKMFSIFNVWYLADVWVKNFYSLQLENLNLSNGKFLSNKNKNKIRKI